MDASTSSGKDEEVNKLVVEKMTIDEAEEEGWAEEEEN